jgi:hypothetical protein
VYECGVVRVGMACFDDVDGVAFEVDIVSIKSFDESRSRFLQLAGEGSFPPGSVVFRLDLLRHVLNCRSGGDNLGRREVLEDGGDGEVVIAVAVGDVNCGELLVGAENAFDPSRDLVALFDGQGWVDEDCFFVSRDKGRGHVRPCLGYAKREGLGRCDWDEVGDVKVCSEC